MARKDLFLKGDSYFHDDKRTLNPKGFNMYKWLIKSLNVLGIAVQDQCCERTGDELRPLIFNRTTGQDGYMEDGVFIPVETATGSTAPGGTTTTSTTSTSTTSTTTTLPVTTSTTTTLP